MSAPLPFESHPVVIGRAELQVDPDVAPQSDEWDQHWRTQNYSFFGRACSWYRRQIRARSVSWYFDHYFPQSGVFVECGSGSSETSSRIRLGDRRLIAVDWSLEALKRASQIPQIAEVVQADIRALPFANQSLDGIWNLGVMEHFPLSDQRNILREFNRVLKPGGIVLLWWPPKTALDRLLMSSFGSWFPAEPGRVNRSEAANLLDEAGFRNVFVDFPINDGLTELLVHAVR